MAARQHGNITRAQVIALGLSDAAISYRAATGRLHRVCCGVYSVGRPPITSLERAAAAVLACGDGAGLTRASAMTLWGFWKRWDIPFEVIVPRERQIRGITTHRSRSLAPRDLTSQLGIRVTTPARTLLDIAPRLDDAALTRAVNDARLSSYLKLAALADLVERCPTHPGAPRLRALLSTGDGPTRAGWEDDFPSFCEHFGLPRPLMAEPVLWYTADALFVAERVIVELDGYDAHSGRAAFESDRDRDADTLAAGFVTVRITWERIHETAAHEAARLHAILATRRAGGGGAATGRRWRS